MRTCEVCGDRMKVAAKGTMHPKCVNAKEAFKALLRKPWAQRIAKGA